MWDLNSVKSIVSDTYFNCFAILLSAGITLGFFTRDFSYWWIPAVICFLLVGRYADELEDTKNKSLCNITYDELRQMESLSDTHLDEMAKHVKNTWHTDYSYGSWQDYKETYEETDSSNCNTCGYVACVCKPIVNNKSEV
tara:strand:+ start:974 stop:1393 length:420 start_codon:yes stop_codon:yes gene_type:complete